MKLVVREEQDKSMKKLEDALEEQKAKHEVSQK